MQKQGEDFFGISYYSTACNKIIRNCSYALEMGGGGLRPPPLFLQSYTLLYPKTFFFLSRFFVSLAPPLPTFNQFASDATGALGREKYEFAFIFGSLHVTSSKFSNWCTSKCRNRKKLRL